MISKIKGLEYFSVDVNILSDVRIFKLLKRYGPLGFTSYMAIISHIYSKGYFVEYDLDTLAYLLLKHIPSKYINGRNKGLDSSIKEEIILTLKFKKTMISFL